MNQTNCPRCQYGTKPDSRFCPNCGLAFKNSQPVKQPLLPRWAYALIGLGVVLGLLVLIPAFISIKRDELAKQQQQASPETTPVPATPTPTPKPTFAELKTKAEALLKLEQGEYDSSDLNRFDAVMQQLREIPKDAKEYKEAQVLSKKLIDKASVIGAEIIVLGKKPKNSSWDGSVREVDQYLKQVLNDYDSAEYIEWSPVTKVYVKKEPFWAVRLKLRAKNGFGAYILRDTYFLIRGGQVVKAEGL